MRTLASLASFASVTALAASAFSAPPLPLKKVRLYETGVGYFERGGRLAPGVDVELPVPAGHLDDALKTLVVLSGDAKAQISGIDFGSSVSRNMARALAGLPAADESPIRYDELMKSLKGAPVEVRTRAGVERGRIIDVLPPDESVTEECAPVEASATKAGTEAPACVLRKHLTVLLLTDKSAIRRFSAPEITSVRPTDDAYSGRLAAALDALSSRGAQTQRKLRVLAASGSAVTLGYVAEAPLWRSTYRLVLGEGRSSMLQGWALVHNDTDEDWSRVSVELVNGQPDSFLFPLAAPRYARRELVTPENQLSTVPQLLDTTVDGMWAGESGDSYGAGGLGLSGSGEGGGGRGYGVGLGSLGTVGHGAGGSGVAPSSLLSVGNLAGVAQAEGVEAGALFRYLLPHPVDLRARGSALVPFVSGSVESRRLAFFERAGAAARSAVRVANGTGQTLPEGTLAVFADGGFAGEAALVRLKPTEAQVVRFGFDLDVELVESGHTTTDSSQLLKFERGDLVEHFLRRHVVTLDVENRSGAPRTAYLALEFVSNARVEGADELDYDVHAGRPAALFDIGARAKATRVLKVDEGLSRRTPLATLGSRGLTRMADSIELTPEQRAVVVRSAERMKEAEIRAGARLRRQADLERAEADVQRLREHVSALGENRTSAGDKLVDRLLAAEDRATRIRTRIEVLEREAEERLALARANLARLGRLAKKDRAAGK